VAWRGGLFSALPSLLLEIRGVKHLGIMISDEVKLMEAEELEKLAMVFTPLYLQLRPTEEEEEFTSINCLHDEPDSSDDEELTVYHPQRMTRYRNWLGLWLNVFDTLLFVSPVAPLYMISNPIIMRFIRTHARELCDSQFTERWISFQNHKAWKNFLSQHVRVPPKRKPRGPVRVP
jgi:hypothetical protein